MISSLYGRMQSGRCVKRDYGYVGCVSDVLALSDARCSGRRGCRISIPDKLFDSVTDCPDDLRRYLAASYECLRVTSPTRESCSGSDYVKPTASSGYIASIVTEETGCGATETPWLLQALPGQRLNLTLHDYGRAPASLNETRSSASHCHVYAIIKERGPSRSYTVCGGGVERTKPVYISASNTVEVRIITPQARKTSRTFMIQYEAIGCADITPPHEGWTQRKDDSLVVGCNDPAKTWRLTCNNTTWMGTYGNCTTDGYFASHVRIGSLPHASSVMVICAVAGLVGIIVMVFGLLWLRRYRRHRRRRTLAGHRAENLVSLKTGVVQQEEYIIGGQYSQAKPQPLLSYHDAKIEENEYACVEEFPQLQQNMVPQQMQNIPHKKRYANSYALRHQPDMIQQYFVLDPEMMAVRACAPEMAGRREEILYEKHVCRVHNPRPELIQPRGEPSGTTDRRTYSLPR